VALDRLAGSRSRIYAEKQLYGAIRPVRPLDFHRARRRRFRIHVRLELQPNFIRDHGLLDSRDGSGGRARVIRTAGGTARHGKRAACRKSVKVGTIGLAGAPGALFGRNLNARRKLGGPRPTTKFPSGVNVPSGVQSLMVHWRTYPDLTVSAVSLSAARLPHIADCGRPAPQQKLRKHENAAADCARVPRPAWLRDHG
jgi:hypothetical protein